MALGQLGHCEPFGLGFKTSLDSLHFGFGGRQTRGPHLGPHALPVVSVAKIEGGLEVRAIAALTGVDTLVAPLSCRVLLPGVNGHGLLLFWRNLKCVQNGSKRVARCHWYFGYGLLKSTAAMVALEPAVEFAQHTLTKDVPQP